MEDLRLAWQLTRGSDRREWLRVLLTAVGAALATGFGLAALGIGAVRGNVEFPYLNGLLDEPGVRNGVVAALLLLLVPVLGFLAQCARIGAVHRDRRLASLRLVGATAPQVRRIAALEAGLACLLGSAVAAAVSVPSLLFLWDRPPLWLWAAFAGATLVVPVVAALVSVLALRRVVASPLGWVRRVRPERGASALLTLGAPTLMVGAAAALVLMGGEELSYTAFPLAVLGAVTLTAVGSVAVSGGTAKLMGRWLAARTDNPAVLIAAERLRTDPWAAARTHAAVLLVTVVGVSFLGIRQMLLDDLNGPGRRVDDMAFYTTGINLTGAAVLVALTITLSGLAVGAAESLATRRHGLAAQAAAGVPQAVLGRALLLETALPLAPAMLLAGLGGTAVYLAYGIVAQVSVPLLLPLLFPAMVYASCLLAAATALPLLRRVVQPGELRYA
ncbi:FtsX-like permease family protein [Streptomyces ureilyticus]|uniref:ABC transporter permease n=1 Tax=Streptomyces ureilyticus TaxID=1775131 RepID=A0ABX0DU18_9ACTN|nr:FtsX-like permease family protein [Streptomyces ureilyticus]NGO45402.1 ABC transporter permease [Streptomyces ureilyticus]